jgi:hypothetical protein
MRKLFMRKLTRQLFMRKLTRQLFMRKLTRQLFMRELTRKLFMRKLFYSEHICSIRNGFMAIQPGRRHDLSMESDRWQGRGRSCLG